MILYKYYSANAGLTALNSSRLGFRVPTKFNDPFELSGLSNTFGYDRIKDQVEMLMESVVILPLTRSPLNPLMWAHYGVNHTGFVLGYDVTIPLLTDESLNIIPVQNGDVFYTQAKENTRFGEEDFYLFQSEFTGALGDPDSSQGRAFLKRIFLQKHLCWSYEEEVRVVKRIHSFFHTAEEYSAIPENCYDTFSEEIAPRMHREKKGVEGLKLYKTQVPIKEVYFGLRNADTVLDEKTKAALSAVEHVRQVVQASDSWGLSFIDKRPAG